MDNRIKKQFTTGLNNIKKFNEEKTKEVMKKFDLRKIDVQILVYLASNDTLDTARDLAETGMFTKGHISQAVKRLVDLGYIYTEKDDIDQRVQHLKLTEKSMESISDVVQQRNTFFDKIFDGISITDTRALERILLIANENIFKNMK